MWNFKGSWLLGLEFARDVTQLCRISNGGAVLFGTSRGKVKKQKIPRGFKKLCPKASPLPPFVCFFWNSLIIGLVELKCKKNLAQLPSWLAS